MKKAIYIVLAIILNFSVLNGQTFNKRISTGNTNGVFNLELNLNCIFNNDTIIIPTGSVLSGLNSNKISFLRYDKYGELLDSSEYVYTNPFKLNQPLSSLYWNDTLLVVFSSFYNLQNKLQNYWLWLNKDLDTIRNINFDPSNSLVYSHNITDVVRDGDSLVCVGQSTEYDPNVDVFIQKYDSAGNSGSIAYYGGSGWDTPVKIIKTSDGGYLISGFTTTGSIDGEKDAFVCKFDVQLNLEWDYYWRNPDFDCPLLVEELPNGNFLACGCESLDADISNDDQQLFSLILSNTGSLISKKNYILPTKQKYTESVKLINTMDGNFALLGQKLGKGLVGPNEGMRGILLKMDANGDSIYYREYTVLQDPAGSNYLRDIVNTSDGGFVMSGFLHPGALDTGNQDLWLMKTNCLGFAHDPVAAINWGNLDNYTIQFKNTSQFCGQTTIHFGDGNSTIQQEGDTTFITHTYAGAGPYQVMVAGEACGTYDTVYYSVSPSLLNTTENEALNLKIYPNPTSEYITIEHQNLNQYTLTIYNLSGQQFPVPQKQNSQHQLELDVSQLPSGQYVVVAQGKKQRFVKQFSVVR